MLRQSTLAIGLRDALTGELRHSFTLSFSSPAMDAGKLAAASATRRVRVRAARHFQRKALLDTRNARAARLHHHQQQRQQQQRARVGGRRTPPPATALARNDKRYNVTREVHDAICGRLGHRPRQIPGDSLQAVFNDMKLYVSNAQVDKMIQCARQGKHMGRKNGGSQYLTFEWPEKFEVFLGGSCNPTTWRTDIAIPELQKYGITYYNPQVSAWAPELVALEHNAKQSACLLFYVIDNQTRSVVGMMEVAYLVASGRCVVLVAHPYRQGQSIMDEPITQSEYCDLMNGQMSLLALVKSQGIKVHSSLATALQCTASILRSGSANGVTVDEQVTHKLRRLREVFDSFDVEHTGEIDLASVADAYQRLTDKAIDLPSLCYYVHAKRGGSPPPGAHRLRISFDQFCVLVAEFGSDDAAPGDDWLRSNLTASTRSAEAEATTTFDLYLGGSQSGADWRAQIEPLLREKSITYCAPSAPDGVAQHALLQLKRPLDSARVLLFYITSDARSLSSMILAAHAIGLGRDVVLCIEHIASEGVQIAGENLTPQAIKDYNRGRVYLADMAKRKQLPVFESIAAAVHAAIERCGGV